MINTYKLYCNGIRLNLSHMETIAKMMGIASYSPSFQPYESVNFGIVLDTDSPEDLPGNIKYKKVN